MMEVAGKTTNSDVGCLGLFDDDEDFYCDPCENDGETQPAEGFCVDCQEYLCSSCFKIHRRPAVWRHHVLLDKDAMPKSKTKEKLNYECTEPCAEHSTKIIEYYCLTHDQLGCSVCVIGNHRTCNDVEHIPHISRQYSECSEINEIFDSLETLQEETDVYTAAVNHAKQKVSTYEKNAKARILQLRDEFNSICDRLKEDVEAVKMCDESKLNHSLGKFEEVSKKIKTRVAVLEKKRAEMKVSQLFTEAKLSKLASAELAEEVKLTRENANIRHYVIDFNAEALREGFRLNFYDNEKETATSELERYSPCNDETRLTGKPRRVIASIEDDKETRSHFRPTSARTAQASKELHTKGSPIPAEVVANTSEAFSAEEKISHREAELCPKNKNVEEMLDAVDRFQNINDKVEFLKNNNYIPEAAKLLEEDGMLEAAANLLLMYGLFDDATTMAKKSLKEEVIAHCLLVTCRVTMSKKDKTKSFPNSFLKQNLQEAFDLFQSCGDSDQFGQVTLLQAELSGNVESIKFGWKAFSASKPFANEAGLVECVDWLVRNEDLGSLQILQTTVHGIEHIFSLCQALLDPNTQTNMERVLKYDQFYGIGTLTQDKVVIHTKEKPICMRMIQGIFKSKSDTKKEALEVQKTEAHEAIVVYLLNRAKSWLKPVSDALNKMRDVTRVCDCFHAGIDCPFIDDVDKPCRLLHSVQTKTSFQQLIELDLLLIEFEGNILEGASNVKKKCPGTIRHVLDDYLLAEDADPNIKYKACVQLWNDLMPAAGHSLLLGYESKSLLQHIRKDKVVVHFKRFLLDKWKMFTAGEKKLRSDAARETEVYLLFEFGYHLFALDTGKRKLERSPEEEMTKLERIFDVEVAAKPNIVRSQRYYTLMMTWDKFDRRTYVTCVAHIFTDAFSFICRNAGDPFEAMMKFSKFQIQLSQRNTTDFNFYPDPKTYLMWLEFYTCIAIFLISKLKTTNFPDFVFVLPSNYFALIQFVQSTFPSSGYSVLDSVGWWMPSYQKMVSTEGLIYERLKGFSFVVSGHAQGIRILDKLLQNCKEDPCNYGLLERLLILNMAMVCNIGKAVPHESEFSLMSSMSHITLPGKSSERMERSLKSIKTCKGIADVATVLCRLLSDRGQNEELFICKWKMGKKSTLEKTRLQKFSLFEASFANENTLPAVHAARIYKVNVTHVESQVEADLDEEALERDRRDKVAQMEKKKANKAVLYVQRMFRAKRELRRLRKVKLNKNGSSSVVDSMFEDIKIDDNMCGICGVFFFEKLVARLELERSVFVGGTSFLNEMQVASSSCETQQGPKPGTKYGNLNACGSSQENQFQSPELRKLHLENIRAQHMQENGHIQKSMELQAFKKNYREHIAPKLATVKMFLFDSPYGLIDQDNVAKNYAREEMAIERMKNKSTLIEKELQLLMRSRMWSTTAGLIEKKMKKLETDFATVQPYVEETYAKLKKEEEERRGRQASASSSVISQRKNRKDELDDRVRRTRESRKSRHCRDRRKTYR